MHDRAKLFNDKEKFRTKYFNDKIMSDKIREMYET